MRGESVNTPWGFYPPHSTRHYKGERERVYNTDEGVARDAGEDMGKWTRRGESMNTEDEVGWQHYYLEDA